MPGRSLADAYVALHPDTSKFSGELRRGTEVPAGDAGKAAGRRFNDRFTGQIKDGARQAGAALLPVARGIDEVGDQAKQAARHVDELGDQLSQVGRRAIFAGIASRLASAGATAAQGFASSFASALPSLVTTGPVVIAVAAAGTALAGILAGAISSALLLGVGGGALAVGIASAFKDPRVDEALRGKISTFQAGIGRKGQPQTLGAPQQERISEGLLDKAKNLFTQLGKPFVQPLVDALGSASSLLDRIGPKLQTIFGSATVLVKPLADTLGTIFERSLPGIQAAVRAAEPLFAKLAEHAAPLGDAISKFFAIIAESGPSAAVVLGDLLTGLEKFLPFIAHIIGDLTHLYVVIRDGSTAAWQAFTDGMAVMVRFALARFGDLVHGGAAALGWVPGIGPKLKEAASQFDAFAARVNIALESIHDRNVAVRVKVTATDVNGHRVSIGEGTTIPRVGGFAEGGWVPGLPGAAQLAVVHGGEYVMSRAMIARRGDSIEQFMRDMLPRKTVARAEQTGRADDPNTELLHRILGVLTRIAESPAASMWGLGRTADLMARGG